MRMARSRATPIAIECAGGCGKTQRVRTARIAKADIYLCTFGGQCHRRALSGIVRLPGMIEVHEFNVAGGFHGLSFRRATPEEERSIDRASAILAAGLRMLKERR